MDRIAFDPKEDRLWLAGDLVNRGPSSLEVLRWVRGLGSSVVAVLGNHDIHLLAVAAGARRRKRRDTLDAVLEAEDAEELLDWLAHRPLLHRDGDLTLVHAGIYPGWSLDEASAHAREVEAALRGPDRAETLRALYAEASAAAWRDDLKGAERLRVILAALTRIRVVTGDGAMDLVFALAPSQAPTGTFPWYERVDLPEKATVFFGHWAALGLYVSDQAVGLDSGCVWGGALTAMRLEDRAIFQERSELAPGSRGRSASTP